jgi:hypothetical protein
MATYPFTEKQKAAIRAKIRELDEKLDAARRAIAARRPQEAIEQLSAFEEMKVGQLITSLPDVRLADRHHGLPFSVLYEDFSEVWRVVDEFLRWLGSELRKPAAQQRLEVPEHAVQRLRRVLESLRFARPLGWQEEASRQLLDQLIARLERILQRMSALSSETALQLLIDEAELTPFADAAWRFMGELSTSGFSLQRAYELLRQMDARAASLRAHLRAPGAAIGLERASRDLEAIESQKHELGGLVEAAPTGN